LARNANLGAVILPFAAVLAAVVLLWNRVVGWSDLALFVFMYCVTALGVTVGYHRLLTHRAFSAPAPVRYALATLGSTSVQGSTLDWVAGGGSVRIFCVHHVTWSINSVCHFAGRRRFATDDHSTNVFWLALPSLGESWHHNHHAFPRSARHGLRWWEVDISGLVIAGLE